MASGVKTFAVVCSLLSAGLAYGCSSDDGTPDGAGGMDSGGAAGKGGTQNSGGKATSGGATASSSGAVGAVAPTASVGGTAGMANLGGGAGKASGGSSSGGVTAAGGAATGGKAAAGATSVGGVQQAGTGGTALAGNVGISGSAGTTSSSGGAAGSNVGGVAGSNGGTTTTTAGTGGVTCSSMAGAAGSGETRTIQSIIVSIKGQNCYDCALYNCSSDASTTGADVMGTGPNSVSCGNMTGVAAAGPATCQSRQTLCYDALQCVLQSNCASVASNTVGSCFCGTSTDCLAGIGTNGACKAQEEAALETTFASVIGNNFGLLTLPGGRANQLVQCMMDAITWGGPNADGDPRCSSCFP